MPKLPFQRASVSISQLQSLSAVILEPKKICNFYIFLSLSIFVLNDGTGCYNLSFFQCRVLSQIFHCSLSPSTRSSLVPLQFLPLGWDHLRISAHYLSIIKLSQISATPVCLHSKASTTVPELSDPLGNMKTWKHLPLWPCPERCGNPWPVKPKCPLGAHSLPPLISLPVPLTCFHSMLYTQRAVRGAGGLPSGERLTAIPPAWGYSTHQLLTPAGLNCLDPVA